MRSGELWRDLDPRSYYDVTSNGELPSKNYVGKLQLRSRIVEVIEADDVHVLIRNVHNLHESRALRSRFHDDLSKRRGFVREQRGK